MIDTRASAPLEDLEPIITKLNFVLDGENYEHSVLATLMLFILLQKPDLDADTLQSIMDDISKHVQMLLTSTTVPLPSSKVN